MRINGNKISPASNVNTVLEQRAAPIRTRSRRFQALVVLFLAALLTPLSFDVSEAKFQNESGGKPDDPDRVFLPIHRDAVVVDGHNDVIGRVLSGADISRRTAAGHSDLVRFREGGVDVQLFSIWIPRNRVEQDRAWAYAILAIDSMDALARRASARFAKVTNSGELEAAHSAGKLAGIVSLEGAEAVGNSREKIIALYKRGLRNFGLTWNSSPSWATSAQDQEKDPRRTGLTAEGKSMVRLLDSLGVIIDVSHLGSKGFDAVLESSRNPVIASHSCCSALCRNRRNLTDDQIRALAKRNGVVMVNFFPGFLRCDSKATPGDLTAYANRIARLSGKKNSDDQSYLHRRDALIAEAKARGLATLTDIADHIEHVIAVAGIDHVGIGSDFDGIDIAPVGMNGVIDLPYLTRELLKRGRTTDEIRKIMGGNFLRVFKRVCG
jgi:membrane dipeptidase